MPEKKITYSQAMEEIEDILDKIESEELDVDILSDKVKRVSHLISLCKKKLHSTEKEVENILKALDEEE